MNPYLFNIIALFSPMCVYAMDYSQAYDLLLTKNPQYQVVSQQYEISYMSYKNAKANRYPNISLRAGADRFFRENATSGYRAYIGPRLLFPVYQGGFLRANKRLLHERMNASQINIIIERNNKIEDLQTVYARAIYAKNNLSVAQNILERSKRNLRLVDLKYRSGHEYRWVLLTTKKNLEEDKLRVLEAELDQSNALIELENLLGPLPIKFVDEIKEEAFYPNQIMDNEFEQADIQQHPEYQFQLSVLSQSTHQVDMSKAARLPNVSFKSDFFLIDTDESPVVPFWSSGIIASLPLINFGNLKRNQKIAVKQRAQEDLKTQQKLRDLKKKYQIALNQYKVLGKRLEIAKLSLEAAQDRSRVFTQKYQNGLTDFFQWNRSQTVLKNAENRMLVQKREWMIAYAQLINAMGGVND